MTSFEVDYEMLSFEVNIEMSSLEAQLRTDELVYEFWNQHMIDSKENSEDDTQQLDFKMVAELFYPPTEDTSLVESTREEVLEHQMVELALTYGEFVESPETCRLIDTILPNNKSVFYHALLHQWPTCSLLKILRMNPEAAKQQIFNQQYGWFPILEIAKEFLNCDSEIVAAIAAVA
jgi:hypothetical protein